MTRPDAAPAHHEGIDELPGVLLPYQAELLEATSRHPVVVCEKSRRIGATWGIAADAVLTAGRDGGMDVFYIGYNLDMTREFIDTCAFWAKQFLKVAVEVKEFLFREQEKDGADREIQAFRINFASGFEIVALCSRPRSLRGRQGYVIIDEAAFHDELDELLKAALALLMWGGKVLVISTHDGIENPFNQLVEDCRAGRRKYHLLRVTFDRAVEEGLYRRICLRLGRQWSPEAEAAWAQEMRDLYGDDAGEELDCIPKASGGKYLPRTLLEARAVDVPVLRWSVPDSFVDLPEETRIAECRAFCDEQIAPLLRAIGAVHASYLGEDFGRSGDLSVMWPLLVLQDMSRRTPFVVELRNIPFKQQEQVLHFICKGLPRFAGAALDARGNGQYLAEAARQEYGPEAIAEVMLSEGWYREHMPPLKAAFEDGSVDLPRDAEIIDDLRSLEVIRGIARVPDAKTKGKTGMRHGDAAIALALALFASRTLEGGPLFFDVEGDSIAAGAYAGDADLGRRDLAGFL